MNTMLKVAVVAALALAVGVTIVPRGPDIGAAPAPSPSPSPSAAPLPRDPAPLAPGTYSGPFLAGRAGSGPSPSPRDGRSSTSILWSDVDGLSEYSHVGGPGEVALGWWDVDNVFTDPCHWQDSLADPPVGPTVDDLATAFVRAGRTRRFRRPT